MTDVDVGQRHGQRDNPPRYNHLRPAAHRSRRRNSKGRAPGGVGPRRQHQNRRRRHHDVATCYGHIDAGDFETYFANLQWEFRVFALNRVWERDGQGRSHQSTTRRSSLRRGAPRVGPEARGQICSASIHVSLNDLDIVQQTTTIEPTVEVSDDAPAGLPQPYDQ